MPRVKPLLRGVFHEAGCYVAAVIAVPFVLSAEAGTPRVAAVVFAVAVVACFGASALYHRPTWTPRTRAWLARLDHAGLYLLIAGTYTPVALLTMSRGWSVSLLAIVWGGTAAAIVLKLVWVQAPKALAAAIALALGWVGIVALSEIRELGAAPLALLLAGGACYSAGAVVYVMRRPDPVPAVLGYHEIFHLLTILAVAFHYAAIGIYILPQAPG